MNFRIVHYEQCDNQPEDMECICDDLDSKYQEEMVDVQIEDYLYEQSN